MSLANGEELTCLRSSFSFLQVCNKGLVMGALAIANEDPTTYSRTILNNAPANAQSHCAFAPSPEGTWSETANYWCAPSSVVFPSVRPR